MAKYGTGRETSSKVIKDAKKIKGEKSAMIKVMKNRYLQSGQQTKITKTIRDIAAGFKSSGIDLIFEILTWIHKNLKPKTDPNYKNKYFRKRTASQIIQSGCITGCTDYALVFITLARAKGIPTKYIEAISSDWLERGNPKHLEGHVFSEIYINNKWHIIDPQAATIKAWYGKRFHILAKGLDSWDIGVKNLSDLKKQFIKFRNKITKK